MSFNREVFGGPVNPMPEIGRTYPARVLSSGVGGTCVDIDAPELPSTSRFCFLPDVRLRDGETVRVTIVYNPHRTTGAVA